jgi:5-methylcytosine-specific restriction endonuclease McrA
VYMRRYYEHHTAVLKTRVRNRDKRLQEVYVEFVDDYKVFERDDWICQICQQPVDSILEWPDPMSKSIDHTIPLSRGGAHEYANVQLAHLRCNMCKGDQVA